MLDQNTGEKLQDFSKPLAGKFATMDAESQLSANESAENSTESACSPGPQRDVNGRLVKGGSRVAGSGRKTGTRNRVTEGREIFSNGDAKRARRVIKDIAFDAKNPPKTRLAAALEIIARKYGKPFTPIETSGPDGGPITHVNMSYDASIERVLQMIIGDEPDAAAERPVRDGDNIVDLPVQRSLIGDVQRQNYYRPAPTWPHGYTVDQLVGTEEFHVSFRGRRIFVATTEEDAAEIIRQHQRDNPPEPVVIEPIEGDAA